MEVVQTKLFSGFIESAAAAALADVTEKSLSVTSCHTSECAKEDPPGGDISRAGQADRRRGGRGAGTDRQLMIDYQTSQMRTVRT